MNYVMGESSQAHDGPAGVIGKTDYDLSPAFLADQFRLDDEQVLRGVAIERRMERVGGGSEGSIWNITSKAPVSNKRAGIVGTPGIPPPSRPADGAVLA